MPTQLDADEIIEFLAKVFPQIHDGYTIERVGELEATVSLDPSHAHLRPGGTVSGPTMFTIADLAFYVATLAMIGPEALTVTANATINFLRKPAPGKIIAEARILKLGRSLSVGDVTIYSDGDDAPVAHATMTYAIPQR